MVQLRRWLDRVRLRWDLSVMKRNDKWGDNEETIEYLLDMLTPQRLDALQLLALKRTGLRTRSWNVDLLVQMVRRARWIVDGLEEVYREETYKLAAFDRSLDDFLVSDLEVPIRAVEAVARLKEDLLPLMQQMLLMEAEDHPSANYYRRQYGWLYSEVREFLQALVTAGDPQMTF